MTHMQCGCFARLDFQLRSFFFFSLFHLVDVCEFLKCKWCKSGCNGRKWWKSKTTERERVKRREWKKAWNCVANGLRFNGYDNIFPLAIRQFLSSIQAPCKLQLIAVLCAIVHRKMYPTTRILTRSVLLTDDSFEHFWSHRTIFCHIFNRMPTDYRATKKTPMNFADKCIFFRMFKWRRSYIHSACGWHFLLSCFFFLISNSQKKALRWSP